MVGAKRMERLECVDGSLVLGGAYVEECQGLEDDSLLLYVAEYADGVSCSVGAVWKKCVPNTPRVI